MIAFFENEFRQHFNSTNIVLLIFILSRVWVIKDGFGLVIGFINHFQVITTINYYTIAALHNLQSLHTNLFSPNCTSLHGFIT
jgi:hypothetical protein